MTIESTRPAEGGKAETSSVHRAGSKSGQTGSAGTTADEGFAGLMSLLSASGDASDAGVSGSDAVLPLAAMTKDSDKKVPLALVDQGLLAINSIPLVMPLASAGVPIANQLPTDLSGGAKAAGKTSAIQATDKWRPLDKADAASATVPGSDASVKGHGGVSDVTTLLNNRPTSAPSVVSQVQAELREVRTHQLAPVPVATPDISRLVQTMASVNGASNPPERTPGKAHSGTSGVGMEGLLGTAQADKLGISPTYEVAAATAVVPDTQVAETVSYWATHGVQSAELTLDGLGKEPVEVRISVAGDQTQVDFRTNQPEVRQALENASVQLKEMLSGEGLQLTGMSIGTSGRGQTPSDGGHQPRPSTRQIARVSLEPVVTTTARVANRSVGQSLDLYV